MIYTKTFTGNFIKRLNRFEVLVNIGGQEERVHIKNTGRLKELLLLNAKVILSYAESEKRKTKYDLIAVYKDGLGLVNIDSMAPNMVVKEWLEKQGFDYIKPEYKYGDSRLDYYMEKDNQKYLLEVKGCTLEKNGIGYFPDAPTIRGVKHLNELCRAVELGYKCFVAFVVQMPKIKKVVANAETHKEFAQTLEKAKKSGVEVLVFCCEVEENSLKIIECI